jgi:HEAT repeat protein
VNEHDGHELTGIARTLDELFKELHASGEGSEPPSSLDEPPEAIEATVSIEDLLEVGDPAFEEAGAEPSTHVSADPYMPEVAEDLALRVDEVLSPAELVAAAEGPVAAADIPTVILEEPPEVEEPAEVEEPLEVEEPAAARPLGQELLDAVREFIDAPDRRDVLASSVRSAGDAARSAHQLDALAESVDELLIHASDDSEAQSLVDHLMNAAAESRMAIRLGQIRDEDRRDALCEAYRRLGASMARAVSEAMVDTDDRSARRTFMRLLISMGEDGMVVIEEMSVDSRWFVARNGVTMIGEIGGDAALGRLTGALAHSDGRVRREAVMALAKIGGEDAGLLSMGLLHDHEAEVRVAAARAVSVLRVQKALRPLLDVLAKEKNQAVVEQVLRALGQIGDADAVRAISKKAAGGMLARNPVEVRVAAIAALGDIGTPLALKTISAAAEDKNPEIQAAARAVWISAAEAKETEE